MGRDAAPLIVAMAEAIEGALDAQSAEDEPLPRFTGGVESQLRGATLRRGNLPVGVEPVYDAHGNSVNGLVVADHATSARIYSWE